MFGLLEFLVIMGGLTISSFLSGIFGRLYGNTFHDGRDLSLSQHRFHFFMIMLPMNSATLFLIDLLYLS